MFVYIVYRSTRNISEEDELPIEIDNTTYNGRSIHTVERSTDKVYDRVRGLLATSVVKRLSILRLYATTRIAKVYVDSSVAHVY